MLALRRYGCALEQDTAPTPFNELYQALRLHAEELQAAAEARAEREAATAAAKKRARRRERLAARRQAQQQVLVHEGIAHVKHMAAVRHRSNRVLPVIQSEPAGPIRGCVCRCAYH